MPSMYDRKLADLAFSAGIIDRPTLRECGRRLAAAGSSGRERNLGDLMLEMGLIGPDKLRGLERRLELAGVVIPPDRRRNAAETAERRAAAMSRVELGDVTAALTGGDMYCIRCGELIVEEGIGESEAVKTPEGVICARCNRKGLQAGEVFHGFRILGEVGSGRLGTAYRARDLVKRADVVLHHLPIALFKGHREARHFQEAAEQMAAFSHPHVADMVRTARAGSDCLIAHTHVPGRPLAEYAAGAGRKDLVRVLIQVAEALQALMLAGMAHGELRPRKVRIGDNGAVRLLDAHLPAPRYFKVGLRSGDERYVAPELAGDHAVESVFSDMYAAGMLLVDLFFGNLCSAEQAVQAVRSKRLPRRLGALITSLTAPALSDRPRTPANMRKELERIRSQL